MLIYMVFFWKSKWKRELKELWYINWLPAVFVFPVSKKRWKSEKIVEPLFFLNQSVTHFLMAVRFHFISKDISSGYRTTFPAFLSIL
ncbi:hypothetical protein ACQZV8_11680 [Magnetococcales bacterium HHB-1]